MEYIYNSTAFERELRLEIEKRRNEYAAQVVSSSGINDFSDYRRVTAYVAALDEALQIMNGVRDRLLQKPD